MMHSNGKEYEERFVCRMIYVMFAEIAFRRQLLARQAFKQLRINGMRMRKFDADDEDGEDMILKMKEICEAIDHQYIKEINLVVRAKSKDGEKIVEMYTMAITYTDSISITLKCGTAGAWKFSYVNEERSEEQLCLVLTRIGVLAGKMEKLPERSTASIVISYTDATPRNYSSWGFSETRPTSLSNARSLPLIHLGAVCTDTLCTSLVVRSLYLGGRCSDLEGEVWSAVPPSPETAVAAIPEQGSELLSLRELENTEQVDDVSVANHSFFALQADDSNANGTPEIHGSEMQKSSEISKEKEKISPMRKEDEDEEESGDDEDTMEKTEENELIMSESHSEGRETGDSTLGAADIESVETITPVILRMRPKTPGKSSQLSR